MGESTSKDEKQRKTIKAANITTFGLTKLIRKKEKQRANRAKQIQNVINELETSQERAREGAIQAQEALVNRPIAPTIFDRLRKAQPKAANRKQLFTSKNG